MWVKPWLRRRINLGFYKTLVQELRFLDESEYKKTPRVTPQNFDEILGLIKIIQPKQAQIFVIRYHQTLAARIRFLATGDKYTNLQYQLRLHTSILSKVIPEVCDTIHKKFKLISSVVN